MNLYRCDCKVVVAAAGKPSKCPACGSKSGNASTAGSPFERIRDPEAFFDL